LWLPKKKRNRKRREIGGGKKRKAGGGKFYLRVHWGTHGLSRSSKQPKKGGLPSRRMED